MWVFIACTKDLFKCKYALKELLSFSHDIIIFKFDSLLVPLLIFPPKTSSVLTQDNKYTTTFYGV